MEYNIYHAYIDEACHRSVCLNLWRFRLFGPAGRHQRYALLLQLLDPGHLSRLRQDIQLHTNHDADLILAFPRVKVQRVAREKRYKQLFGCRALLGCTYNHLEPLPTTNSRHLLLLCLHQHYPQCPGASNNAHYVVNSRHRLSLLPTITRHLQTIHVT